MIGLSVSDIIKLLEQVPGWKAVVALPRRLAELEARVKALERGQARPKDALGPKDCPICGAVMSVVEETDDPNFGPMGVKIHRMHCDNCGQNAKRQFEPGKGYN
jgi:copper chaperone CopZ